MKGNEWLSLPNLLSYFRILLIPFFVYVYVQAQTISDFYVAGFILIVSGLTDYLDGFIARKFNKITEVGKLLDPIADKLTQVAVAATLMFSWSYMWILLLLFVIKESNMFIHNILLYRKGKRLEGALWYGKVATASFYLCMFVLIVLPELHTVYTTLLMVVTAFFQIISFVGYTNLFYQMHKSSAP